LAIANAASDKKALDIVMINMRKMPSVCDYFVIASGTSTTQVSAIADNIIKVLHRKSQRLWHSEGQRDALWVLLDFGDVVAHVFLDETRHFYDLERLWGDAPQERYREARRRKVSRRKTKAKRKVKRRPSKRTS
jgi:ribosome-associated protein